MVVVATVVVKDVVCRQNCATNGKNLGVRTGQFNVLEERDRNGIIWYRIGENEWIQSGSGVDFIPDTVENIQNNPTDNTEPVTNTQLNSEMTAEESTAEESNISGTEIFNGAEEVPDSSVLDDTLNIPETNVESNIKLGQLVTFSGTHHYATPNGNGGAIVKPCMAKVTYIVHGTPYPFRLHRCNSASVLIPSGEMGYVAACDISVIPS